MKTNNSRLLQRVAEYRRLTAKKQSLSISNEELRQLAKLREELQGQFSSPSKPRHSFRQTPEALQAFRPNAHPSETLPYTPAPDSIDASAHPDQMSQTKLVNSMRVITPQALKHKRNTKHATPSQIENQAPISSDGLDELLSLCHSPEELSCD
jgi:hypothetical protein